jgi:hypothetical protein
MAMESSSAKSLTLRRNAIGLPGVLFQSITTMAPASAVAFNLCCLVCPGHHYRRIPELATVSRSCGQQYSLY